MRKSLRSANLSFLHDVVMSHPTTSNIPSTTQENNKENEEYENQREVTPSSSAECSFSEQPAKKRIKIDNNKLSGEVDAEVLRYIRNKRSTHESLNDIFCKSIAKMLDQLDERKQDMARLKIQQIIVDIKYQE